MANTYSWLIVQLDCYAEHDGKANVVNNIHWRRQGSDGKGHTADVYDEQSIEFNAAQPFTAFDNLTKAQVVKWLEAALGAEKIAQLDAELNRKLAEQANPPFVAPELPW